SSQQTHVPLLKQTQVTLSGSSTTYQTTYLYHSFVYSASRAANFNDFGRPYQIDEQGELSRSTTRTFKYLSSSDSSFATFIVDKTNDETVTVGDESFVKSYGYLTNGFMTSKTIYGITTTFTPDGAGNVDTETEPGTDSSHTTNYGYDWGVANSIQTPMFTIS